MLPRAEADESPESSRNSFFLKLLPTALREIQIPACASIKPAKEIVASVLVGLPSLVIPLQVGAVAVAPVKHFEDMLEARVIGGSRSAMRALKSDDTQGRAAPVPRELCSGFRGRNWIGGAKIDQHRQCDVL